MYRISSLIGLKTFVNSVLGIYKRHVATFYRVFSVLSRSFCVTNFLHHSDEKWIFSLRLPDQHNWVLYACFSLIIEICHHRARSCFAVFDVWRHIQTSVIQLIITNFSSLYWLFLMKYLILFLLLSQMNRFARWTQSMEPPATLRASLSVRVDEIWWRMIILRQVEVLEHIIFWVVHLKNFVDKKRTFRYKSFWGIFPQNSNFQNFKK